MSEETVDEAIFRAKNQYSDKIGRITLYHNGDYPKHRSENQFLWSGEFNIMLLLHSKQTNEFKARFEKSLMACGVKDTLNRRVNGLYSRHPDPYRFEGHGVSWDEYNGIMFSCATFPHFRFIANSIVNYGHQYNWAYIDEKPYTDPLEEAYEKPWGTLRELFSILIGKNAQREDPDTSNQVINYLSRIRQPRDRGFYKIVSKNEKPRWIEVFHIMIASLLTSKKSREHTSGKKMAWFRFQTLRVLGYRSRMINYAWKKFNKRMIKMYGDDYMAEIYKIYYKDTNHPFHTLIKGLSRIGELK